MYDYTEDTPAPHNTAPLENTPPTHSLLEEDGEATSKYSKDSNPQRDLVEILEHFQQLQEWLTQLKPTPNPSVHIEELAHLTNKLQQVSVTLQLCPPSRSVEESLHTAMQKNTDTLCTPQWQTNLTTSLLQDIPTFDGWDTTKLEGWLSDTEMAADILKESQAWLADAKSCYLTCTLICKALQAGKCWGINFRYIIHLKLCNADIHTYTLHFMEIQQRENEMLAAYAHWFKTETKRYDFNSNTAAIHIFVKGL